MRNGKQDWKAGVVMSLLVATSGATGMAESAGTGTDTGNNSGGSAAASSGAASPTVATPRVMAGAKGGTRGGPPTEAPYDEMAINDLAASLIRTLTEERAEVRQLAAQQAAFRKMGGRQNLRIASMLGRWIREHKAAEPRLVALIRRHAGNPELAVVRKSPILGDRMQMLHATHQDHVNAVVNSQARYKMASSNDVRAFMHKRANMSRKHIRQMAPYMRGHNMRGQNMQPRG